MKHFISSLSVINANTPPCEGRVSSRKILSLLLILFLSIGNAWAETATITFKNQSSGTSDGSSAYTTSNFVSSGIASSDAAFGTITCSATSKCYSGKTGMGLKAGGSSAAGSFTITFSTPLVNVSKVTLNAAAYRSDKSVDITVKNGSTQLSKITSITNTTLYDIDIADLNIASFNTLTIESTKYCYIKSITITYNPSAGGSTDPSLSANPTEIDFGTVYQDATVEDKTVAVNFANLTGSVSYSGLSTPFSATGTVSNNGDKITIAANTSTIGEYSQTLNIASAADSKTAEVTVKMNVVAAPAPTGTFTLYTGDLIEGDYVVVYDGIAMTNTVSSNRLANTNVTITDNKIVDPLAATIWHIAKSGEYWTIYNEAVNSYAASNGTKNQAQMLADGTDDKALWTATKNGDAFNFENKHNASNSVNAKLQRNGTYGWACYAAYSEIRLYRKAGTQYNVNVSATENGTVTANPTSAEAGTIIALTVTPESGYVLDALTVTDASSNTIEVADNKFTMPAANVTVAATFKLNEKPAATLTLSKNGVTENLAGSYKQDDVVMLPSITSDCVKEFVGWSAHPTCNVAPEYKAGDSYTLASTEQILYAVYADVTGGETVNIAYSGSTTNMDGTNQAATFGLDNTKWSVVGAKGGASNNVGLNKDGEFRLYYDASGGNTLTITAPKTIAVAELDLKINYNNAWVKVGGNTITPVDGVYTINATEFVIGNANTESKQVHIFSIDVTLQGDYSNYSTTCAAAPKAEVNPAEVTATAAGGNGIVSVTYENVNTEGVTVALFNDQACTETFTAGWLTAAFDADKNITYTVTENTTYAERKAYIKLTAPETTGATEPAVVVIPVTQAGKDKVFASLAELVAADLTAGDEVTVTLNNDMIKSFYTITAGRAGVVFDVQKDGKDIKIFYNNQTTIGDWEVGGKLSGTLTNVKWSTYSNEWQLAPTANTWDWANLTYTAPATIASIAVTGTPTKTTYTDGEAFNPAGLVATATYTDATNEDVTNLVSWTFDPATLTKGTTSVNVTATLNSVSSPTYEVTGLTVNDIPTKTVAEFIAAGGIRCYLEGIVSNIANTTYGNFDLTDETGTIFVYGCLNAAGESKKFAELGVKNGDKIKVIADDYELYDGTTEEAKNVQYVSHISAATITISDITMEVGETKTIEATVTPDAAKTEVTYSIKAGSDDCITLSENNITANAVGTATITATIATAAEYMGKTVEFEVTVTPKTEKTDVVILAELGGKWYAMKGAVPSGKSNQLDALEVTYFNGTLYNVAESDKASITWTRSVVDGKATFVNNGKYLKGDTDTDLTLAASVDDNCKWMWDDEKGYYTTNTSGTIRTFLYRENYNFKNYGANQAGKEDANGDYSALPVVTAPVYVNLNTSSVKTVEKGIFSVADDKFVQFSTGNLQYEVGTNTWSFASEQYEVIGGEAYTGSNNTNYGMNVPGYTGKLDLFAWSCDGKFGVNPSNADADYTGEFADWGNLVNETGWYTLTKDEMTYILNRKKDGKKLWALATINDKVGLVLLPDNWNTSTTLEYGYVPADFNYTQNQLDAAAWAALEAAGAVFLPAAGSRTGGYGNKIGYDGETVETDATRLDANGDYFHVDNVGEMGYYWLNSTTSENADYLILPGWSEGATDASEDDICLQPLVWSREKRRGNSVRLVKEVTPDYTRDVRQGYYGTICLENGGQMIGASLFGLSYYNEAQGLLYMDEVGTTTMTAGNPYIFLPNEGADKLYVFYDETTAAAKIVNGLVGYLGDENMQLEGNGTNYILQDNKIKKVVGGNNSNVFVTKNRAYIQLGDVDPNEPAPVPGRRRVAIGQAPQVATGMENVDASAQPVKTIINGQLFILRGEKMYDAQGKLVK